MKADESTDCTVRCVARRRTGLSHRRFHRPTVSKEKLGLPLESHITAPSNTSYAALGYTGANAPQQAAAAHTQAKAQDDWRDGGVYREREAETAAPLWGGGGWGGYHPSPSSL
jgi:hypothetical protein